MVRMLDEGAKGDGAKPDGSIGIDPASQPLDKLQGRLVVLVVVALECPRSFCTLARSTPAMTR